MAPFPDPIWGQQYMRKTDNNEALMNNQQGTGQKHDGGKILAACLFEYFPDALMDVAEVATYGANKYVRNGWKDVPEKETRYADAFFRHILHNYMGEDRDDESGLRHKAHAAWNALALLQMEIEKNKNPNEQNGLFVYGSKQKGD